MENYIILAVLALILLGAGFYIYKAKKSGRGCIGCPSSKTCSGGCSGCNGSCCSHEDEK